VKRIVLLLMLVLFAGGCHVMHDQIRGSGKVLKEKREIGNFTSIATEGAFDIEIVCQKPASLELEGDDNILPLVTTEVSNNVLHLKQTRSYSVSRSIVVRISVPDLQGIASSGTTSLRLRRMVRRQ
jgi:hypothetical protein